MVVAVPKSVLIKQLDFQLLSASAAYDVQRAIADGKPFVGYIPADGLAFVLRNFQALAELHALEEAWLSAYVFASNYEGYGLTAIKAVFDACRREKLLELGPIVATPMTIRQGRISLFRGCVGPTHSMGMSWTSSLDKAIWYAAHHRDYGGVGNVAVYATTVTIDEIYCCLTRNEEEYIVLPSTAWTVSVPAAEFRLDRAR